MLRRCNLEKVKDYSYDYILGIKVLEDLLEVYIKLELFLNVIINNKSF